jgi:hypothetical protein
VAKVIEELLKIWKECKIVHESPRHPQSQGSVDRANVDIETMVTQWMKYENSTKWSWGIHFIVHTKNNRYHEGIKQIPYVLRYGQPCRVGLSRMNLPAGLLSQLQSEEDLEAAMEEASVITATHARNAAPAQEVTITEAAQAESTEVQVVVREQKKRKAASSQVAETIDYQPGEYELMVIQKRKRNEEKLKQLGLNVAKKKTIAPPATSLSKPAEGIAPTKVPTTAEDAALAEFTAPAEVTDPVAEPAEVTAPTKETAPAAAEVTGPAAPATVAASAEVSDALPKPTATDCPKVSFGRCSLNERCRGPKRSLTGHYAGCKGYLHFCCGRVLFSDEEEYKQCDLLCPNCDSRVDPALLCLPITQFNDSSSDEGGVDGNLSYCLQCYGKVAHTRKESDEEEEVPLSIHRHGQQKSEEEENEEDESEESEEEEESDESDEEEEEDELVRNQIESGHCCCGCGLDAGASNHYCIHTGNRVMVWCYHESQEVEEGHGSRALCKRCYDTIAPKDGAPNRKAMRASAKEAITQQGNRMRRYAQDRAQGKKTPLPPAVGTLVRVKVDKVDRGKLDHKSVPGVICEVTEHGNYQIVCKGSVLKDCLMAQHFQVEQIKNQNIMTYRMHWKTGRGPRKYPFARH